MKDENGILKVAVLSDTHGLLRPVVLSSLSGVDHILHAGDVGDVEILRRLGTVAPVTAIRGNVDTERPCALLPATEMVALGGVRIYLVHSVADLDIEPRAAGVRLVVSGHSHRASLATTDGVTYLNPGSVGPRRFKLPVAMAFVLIRNGELQVEQVQLEEE